MVFFNFFKSLFKRRRKKKVNKKPARKLFRKKANKIKKKNKIKLDRRLKNKPTKKLKKKLKKVKRSNKKAKRIKPAKFKGPKEKEIGVITHYFDKISVGIIKLKNPLAISEHIHIKGKNTDFTQVISSMQHNHKDITLASRGLEIGIKVPKPVSENDLVYKIIL